MSRAFGRAVIIGLGGTGQNTLLRIKQMFLDHCDGQWPPCVKLLAFDTSARQEHVFNARGERVMFDKNEFHHLGVGEVRNALAANEYIKNWWINYPPLDNTVISEGTGGIRQVGRMAVFVNVNRIEQLLGSTFTTLKDMQLPAKMRERKMELLEDLRPQVFVVGSFAGGTGSGTFCDMSVLCRHLGGEDMIYSAFFMMPWVYQYLAQTPFENAYAALLELEQLNSCSASNPREIQYSKSLTGRLTDRPYHIVNLVDGKCRNRYRVASNAELSQFIGECIFNSVGAIGEAHADVGNNITQLIFMSQPADWHRKRAIYSSFGVSSIVYPAREIHERISLEYADDMLDLLKAFVRADRQKEAGGTSGDLSAFIQQNSLMPDDNGLLGQLLPHGTLTGYAIDDDIDPRSDGFKAEVQNDLDRYEKRESQQCQEALKRNVDVVGRNMAQKIREELDQIRDRERRGEYKKGAFVAAVKGLRGFLANCREKEVNEEIKRENAKCKGHQDDLEPAARALEERKVGFFARQPARDAYAQYAEVRQQIVHSRLRVECLRVALKLYDLLEKRLAQIEQDEVGKPETARAKTVERLDEVRMKLRISRDRLASDRLRDRQPTFEIYVGEDDGGTNTAVIWRGSEIPKAEAGLAGFREKCGIENENSLNEWSKDKIFSEIIQFAREKTRAILDMSVLGALDYYEDRSPGFIARVMDEAVKKSTILLPIQDEHLAGKSDIVREFSIVGGHNKDDLRSRLEDYLPTDDKLYNLWASTGDPYRITLCRYIGVLPLYVIKELGEARAKYFERAFPPSHIDRRFEFHLEDAMPEEPNEIECLRLISLSMLGEKPLIQRVVWKDHKKHYIFDRRVLAGEGFINEDDQLLPGVAGKFYSLYAEMTKRRDLLDKLKAALMRENEDRASFDALYAAIEKQYERFKEILDARYEVKDIFMKDAPFNKQITGNLYQKQVDFFGKILKNRPGSIQDMLDME